MFLLLFFFPPLSKINRMWSLFPKSFQPYGHEMPTLGPAFGDRQRQPIATWLMASVIQGAKEELNWDYKNALLLPIRPFLYKTHCSPHETNLVHMWFHSWHLSTSEEENMGWRSLEVKRGAEQEESRASRSSRSWGIDWPMLGRLGKSFLWSIITFL